MANQLILRGQDGDGDYVVIETSPFRVGRSPDMDLRIRHPGVSSVHAEFREAKGAYLLADLSSTNGTFVNGVRIDGTVALRVGDILHFGGVGFRVAPPMDLRKGGATRTIPDASGRVRGVIELFRILQEGRCWPAFQPIYDLVPREVVGWEALGRPVSKNVGGPGPLFKLAEENHAAQPLSAAFRAAAGDCASCRHCWPDRPPAFLFVNLHPAEILVPDFPALLDEIASGAIRRWYRPVLELPESLVCNTRELVVWVEEIRARGMLVAYDDFGRGQSRLPDLVHAPPDFLKLDRELVVGLGTRGVQDDLVKAVVDACGRLDVTPIAEGIETYEELDACVDMGIAYGQGYVLDRPLPAWELFGADPESLPEACPFVRHRLLPSPAPAPGGLASAD